MHLLYPHDIIDIEKEATVDGCPLVSQEMTAQFVRRGRSFFCADIFAEGIAQGKAGKCKSEDADDDVIGRSFVHANSLLPVEICRRATVTVEGVQNPSVHQMKHLTQRATAYRWWPSGAEMLPIFLL